MAYIRASGHSVPLMIQIAEGGHARVYANVLHTRFGFHPTSIYIEEEVLFKSGKVDRTILQLSFRDDEGQLWLLPLGRYRAFGPSWPHPRILYRSPQICLVSSPPCCIP
jgi:hypothetical protein